LTPDFWLLAPVLYFFVHENDDFSVYIFEDRGQGTGVRIQNNE
jgi:hypothetical protein